MAPIRALAALLLFAASPSALAQPIPPGIVRQLPRGFTVLATAHAPHVHGHDFYFIALASDEEKALEIGTDPAPARPLLIFEHYRNGRFSQIGRNDEIVMKIDQGGQCDPFDPGLITTKGAFFTVENEVACGSHWTDYVTFRFDPAARGYVFDNRRTESWLMNPSDDPHADALVSGGQHVTRSTKSHTIPFARWKRPVEGYR